MDNWRDSRTKSDSTVDVHKSEAFEPLDRISIMQTLQQLPMWVQFNEQRRLEYWEEIAEAIVKRFGKPNIDEVLKEFDEKFPENMTQAIPVYRERIKSWLSEKLRSKSS